MQKSLTTYVDNKKNFSYQIQQLLIDIDEREFEHLQIMHHMRLKMFRSKVSAAVTKSNRIGMIKRRRLNHGV